MCGALVVSFVKVTFANEGCALLVHHGTVQLTCNTKEIGIDLPFSMRETSTVSSAVETET